MRAFYVDLNDDGSWARSATLTRDHVLQLLIEAVNDYSLMKRNATLPGEKSLAKALEGWAGRPGCMGTDEDRRQSRTEMPTAGVYFSLPLLVRHQDYDEKRRPPPRLPRAS
jgi:hypothetical protein